PDPAHPEHRARVAGSARLQVTAHPLELAVGLPELQLEVHPLLRSQIVRTQHLARDSREPLAELAQPITPDGQARRHLMAAVALQQVTAGEERRVEIEPGDAPSRALADVAIERDQEGRPPVALDQSGGDDADHAGMPSLTREHEAG